jgi:hypothetical protein
MAKLHFRPHHFLCTLCFQGKGYSERFVQNYQNIVDNLSDDTLIHVTSYTDSICAPCPHKQGLGCASQATIDVLDQGHAKALCLKPDETLTWGQATTRIKTYLTIDTFHDICAPCPWKGLGICERVLTEFLIMQEASLNSLMDDIMAPIHARLTPQPNDIDQGEQDGL